MKNQSPQMNIGIDISKGKLDAYLLERNGFRTFDNDKNGIKKTYPMGEKIPSYSHFM
jgi:hypothetical protein